MLPCTFSTLLPLPHLFVLRLAYWTQTMYSCTAFRYFNLSWKKPVVECNLNIHFPKPDQITLHIQFLLPSGISKLNVMCCKRNRLSTFINLNIFLLPTTNLLIREWLNLMDWSSVEKLSYLYMTWSGIKTAAREKTLGGKNIVRNYFYIFFIYIFSWKSPLTLNFVWILEEGDYFLSFFNSLLMAKLQNGG